MNKKVMQGHKDDEREDTHEDEVGGKGMSCVRWTEEWWKWLLKLEEDKNPVIAVANPTLDRYRAGQPNKIQKKCMKDTGESIWFLAASPYSASCRIAGLIYLLVNGQFLLLSVSCRRFDGYFPIQIRRRLDKAC